MEGEAFSLQVRLLARPGAGDPADALRIDGEGADGLRQLHRQEVIGFAALNGQQQSLLSLLGNGDDKGLRTLLPGVQVAAEDAALQGDGPARHGLAQHAAHVPARLVRVVHPGDREHIAFRILKEALAGPLKGLRRGGLRRGRRRLRRLRGRGGIVLFFSAGRQGKDQADSQQHTDRFFHRSFSFVSL